MWVSSSMQRCESFINEIGWYVAAFFSFSFSETYRWKLFVNNVNKGSSFFKSDALKCAYSFFGIDR